MIPTAVSQVCETIMRIVFVLLFAYMMLPRGVEYAAAGAMAGVLVGEIGGLLVIMFYYWRNRKGYTSFTKASYWLHVRFKIQ